MRCIPADLPPSTPLAHGLTRSASTGTSPGRTAHTAKAKALLCALLPALLRHLLPVLLLLAAWGCAPDVYRTRVESSADAGAFEPTLFTIAPSQRTASPGDFDFRRMAKTLADTLTAMGFQQAPDPSQAFVIVHLGFGLVGEEVPHQGAGFDHLFVLELEAVDALAQRAGRGGKSIWKSTATAHGHLDHWHKVYKVLLATAAPFIGQNSAQSVTVTRDPVTGAYAMQAH